MAQAGSEFPNCVASRLACALTPERLDQRMNFEIISDMRVFQVAANPPIYEYAPSPKRAIEQAVEHYGTHIMGDIMNFGAPVALTNEQLSDIFCYNYAAQTPPPLFLIDSPSDNSDAQVRQVLQSRAVIHKETVKFSGCEKLPKPDFHRGGHTERQWEGKFFRCGMRCYYCLKPLTLVAEEIGEQATKDHLTPVSRGGSNLISNIVPACIDCNQRKGAMTEPEFRKTFSEAFKLLTGVGPAEMTMLMAQDEPSLLRLRFEGEISGSSAWRTK
jgi:5-methylcytosine-specific restriction endonuclease McrA